MQNKPNKLLQKNNTKARTRPDPLAQARAAVADALILQPKIRAVDLAEAMLNNAFEFEAELKEILARNFYISAYHAAKKMQSAEARNQLLLPGFEHLPVKVPGIKTQGGKRIPLLDADYTTLRTYYRSLLKAHHSRKEKDPRIIEAQSLLKKMNKYSRTERGITVRQVMLLPE